MTLDPDVCVACGAGGSCADCLGSFAGAVPDRPDETRKNCGGSCSEERCGASLPDPGPGEEGP